MQIRDKASLKYFPNYTNNCENLKNKVRMYMSK